MEFQIPDSIQRSFALTYFMTGNSQVFFFCFSSWFFYHFNGFIFRLHDVLRSQLIISVSRRVSLLLLMADDFEFLLAKCNFSECESHFKEVNMRAFCARNKVCTNQRKTIRFVELKWQRQIAEYTKWNGKLDDIYFACWILSATRSICQNDFSLLLVFVLFRLWTQHRKVCADKSRPKPKKMKKQ